MKKTTLSICLGFSLAVFANDTQFLIREMENLRNSLKIDDPKKIELTLRLADLYFDSSITEGNKDEEKAFVESRKKALDLYKQSFANAQIEKNKDEIKSIKILFQMARLHTRLEDFKTAESYYLQILANPTSPAEFKEQSALALAEWYEEEVQYAKALKFYDDALSFCKDLNSCNYANYRKGWLFFKDTKIQEAIAAMEKSLWNKDGSVRENSLTDYILFLSNQDGNGDL
jgi:tetratricopeptide (TPR) repeat protein